MAKDKQDPRHKRRQEAIKALFAWNFEKSNPLTALAKEVIKKLKKIDKVVTDCAPRWPLEKINRIDLAILRLAIYELYFNPKVPDKVVIDEAIELAKEFGADSSPGFINGVLGAAYTKLKKGKEKNGKKS